MLTMSYKDQDEKELRDKLVSKLKQKAEESMASSEKRLKKKQERRKKLHDIADEEDEDSAGDTANDDVRIDFYAWHCNFRHA